MKRLIFLLLCFCSGLTAQTGGTYRIDSYVVASGGGASANSNYVVETTIGQPAAGGPIVGGTYSLYAGFITPGLAPTAASVSVSGRVMSADGMGIHDVEVVMQGASGEMRLARTSSFGYYSFTNVAVSETYLISVMSKSFEFANPTRTVQVHDGLTDVDFVALPR